MPTTTSQKRKGKDIAAAPAAGADPELDEVEDFFRGVEAEDRLANRALLGSEEERNAALKEFVGASAKAHVDKML